MTTRAIGDRVAIAWLGYACGECRYCNSGWATLCERQETSGYSINGAFAEYAVVSAAFASPVPEGVSSRDAAPLACAGVTTSRRSRLPGSRPRSGHHLRRRRARASSAAVCPHRRQVRHRRGHRRSQLTMASELGADHVVNALTSDPVEAIQALGVPMWPSH